MVNKPYLNVEVAYATKKAQWLIPVSVLADSCIEAAILASGILEKFPELNLASLSVGIFSEARQLSDKVQEGDRIEIYRPLFRDPKEARRQKAKAAQSR